MKDIDSMEFDSKFWHLSQFRMSKRLSKEEMVHMCSALEMRHFKKGSEMVIRNNNRQDDVFFLKSGTIKIVSVSSSGEEIVKSVIKKGDIFGLLNLMGMGSANDYAIAMDNSLVCIIDATYITRMMAENQKLNSYVLKLAGLRIRKLENSLASLLYKDASTRISHFIFEHVKEVGIENESFFIAKNLLSNREIGKLTFTSRQTVNKTLNGLKREGVIDFDKSTIKLRKEALPTTVCLKLNQ
ncbi:Crp/Fnr family transcriptional regulator [Flagellimonas sp. 2504JD4-2]